MEVRQRESKTIYGSIEPFLIDRQTDDQFSPSFISSHKNPSGFTPYKEPALRISLALALTGLVFVPLLVAAKSHGEKLSRMPDVVAPNNSQTMSLLEGYLNINPTGTGGSEIAIVDNSALVAEGEDSGAFVDAPKSGGQISVYIVREGDTLSEIAEMFDVSINTIVWANDIQRGKISPGQELVILPISGIRHTVKSGDTLSTIAKKYKAEMEDLLAFNGLASGSKLAAGDVIIVPNGIVSSSPSTSSSNISTKGSTSVASGYFIRPISGGRKSQGIHGYNGVDIAAPVGTPIVASASGTVIVARPSGYNGGYGLYVVVRHANGTQTLYAHMSKVNVTVGQKVSQGQVIGAVGNTGRSTGPHIHFEVRGAKNPF